MNLDILTRESGISLLPYLKGEMLEVFIPKVDVAIVVPRVLCGPKPNDKRSLLLLLLRRGSLFEFPAVGALETWFLQRETAA